jgi:hypothetical protein
MKYVCLGYMEEKKWAMLSESERNTMVGVQDQRPVSVADFVMAYTLDWGNEYNLLDDCPQLLAYTKRMYARPHAPPRIAEALAAISAEQNSAGGDG